MAAAARSSREIGVIDHPHPGQNASFAGIAVPQCGQFTEACGGLAVQFSRLFMGLLLRLGSAAIFLLAAWFANPVDLERVTGGDVTVFVPDFPFDLSDFFGKEFHRGAALGANHVVMAAPVVLVFVTRDA